jgi:hypothetical protein
VRSQTRGAQHGAVSDRSVLASLSGLLENSERAQDENECDGAD